MCFNMSFRFFFFLLVWWKMLLIFWWRLHRVFKLLWVLKNFYGYFSLSSWEVFPFFCVLQFSLSGSFTFLLNLIYGVFTVCVLLWMVLLLLFRKTICWNPWALLYVVSCHIIQRRITWSHSFLSICTFVLLTNGSG